MTRTVRELGFAVGLQGAAALALVLVAACSHPRAVVVAPRAVVVAPRPHCDTVVVKRNGVVRDKTVVARDCT